MGYFTTWNPADKNAGVTLADSNTTAFLASGSGWRCVRAVDSKDHGRWYFEISITTEELFAFGIGKAASSLTVMPGNEATSWAAGNSLIGLYPIQYYHNSGATTSTFANVANGDIYMCAVDIDAGKVWFGRNGVWATIFSGYGQPAAGLSPTFAQDNDIIAAIFPILGLNTAGQITANFGSSPFAYTPPAGYSGWGDIELEVISTATFGSESNNLQPDQDDTIGVVDNIIGAKIQSVESVDNDATITDVYDAEKAIGLSGSSLATFSDEVTEETDIIGVQREPSTWRDDWIYYTNYVNEGAALTLPMLTILAEGYDSCSGEMDATLPALTIDATGVLDGFGSLDLVLPMITFEAEGEDTILGYLDAALPMITLSAEGYEHPEGTLDIILPMLRLSVEKIDGATGEMTATIPMITIDALGYLSCSGELDATIPMVQLSAEMEPDTYHSMVLNIRNNALTIYNNYLFNSMCRFNGVNLGATSTKIFNLNSGTKDDGAEIDWNFRLPYLNMEIKTKKHLRLAWFSYKSNGDIIVTVVQPDGAEYEYNLKGYEITEDGVRVKFGKGIKSKYLAIDVRSKDGSTIDLDTIRILMDAFKTR